MTTTGTVTVSPITLSISGADIAQCPELLAEIEALHVEMPDPSFEQILSNIIGKRIRDHFSALATKPA